MKSFFILLSCTVYLVLNTSSLAHAQIDLWDWGINIDGTSYCLEGPCDFDFFSTANLSSLDELPPSINFTNFNLSDQVNPLDGLGTLTITITDEGPHSVSVYFNYDLDYDLNDALNETGIASGSPKSGQFWEIDEIGWGLTSSDGTKGTIYYGDIFDNVKDSGKGTPPTSLLDNQVFYTLFTDQFLAPPIEDTALAMSWDFDLPAGKTAVISFIAGTTSPVVGFYIVQQDPDSGTNVYLSSSTNQDCAGTWDGDAVEDICGICDNNPANDCTGKQFPWVMFSHLFLNKK